MSLAGPAGEGGSSVLDFNTVARGGARCQAVWFRQQDSLGFLAAAGEGV
jgi:hypothetical protein